MLSEVTYADYDKEINDRIYIRSKRPITHQAITNVLSTSIEQEMEVGSRYEKQHEEE
jgi:hypothetical protein